MIPLRHGTVKDPSSTQQIPDCVFKYTVSAKILVEYQTGQALLTLEPSPVIGDLRPDADYDVHYYWWTSQFNLSSTSPQKFSGDAGTAKMISNKQLPVFPRRSMGVIRTSAPEGEIIVTGNTTCTIPLTEATWFIFQLINRADPLDHHQSELALMDPVGRRESETIAPLELVLFNTEDDGR